MYLFTRTARLVAGNPTPGITWGTEVCGKVRDLTDHPIQLWTTSYSPGVGTLVWSSWFEDLPSLERVTDKLGTDGGYQHMLDTAKDLFEGPIDDQLVVPVHGQPNADRSLQYVTSVRAVPVAGSFEKAIGKGIEIAERAEAVTGVPTMFVRALTGSYGAVGWLTGHESIAEVQEAEAAMAADEGWLRLVDEASQCYVDDPTITQQTIHRRLV